jgi:hypothetical protein
MTDQCSEKAVAKAWMFDMLAKIEMANEVHGTRVQSGDEVTIKVKLK